MPLGAIPKEEGGAKAMSEDRLSQLVDRLLAAWNSHDVGAVLGRYTEDVVYRDPNTRGNVEGADAMRRYLRKVFTHWRMTWASRGQFQFDGTDGAVFLWRATFRKVDEVKNVEVEGADLLVLRGDLIARNDVYYDLGQLIGGGAGQTAIRFDPSVGKLRVQPTAQQAIPAERARPYKISVLGAFGLEVHGEPFAFKGKAPRRPLDLLKALIAFGGNQVQDWVLADALWPDSDGSAAAQALATTLHRLRRILGNGELVIRQSGTLTLNRALCHIDLWELEDLLGRAPVLTEYLEPSPATNRDAEEALKLYKPFLGREQTIWALECRHRLRRQVLTALRAWAAECLLHQRFDRAVPILEGALEIDGLAEDCYRSLMHCLVSMGRRAEALACYQLCRGTLRSTLSTDPSGETTALYRKIQSDCL
jgi:DNA-binding SARP family transcriptional activator/ketosteroid isomerase-like protein